MNDATKRKCIVLSRGPFTVNIVCVLGFVDISYQEGEDVAKNLMVLNGPVALFVPAQFSPKSTRFLYFVSVQHNFVHKRDEIKLLMFL